MDANWETAFTTWSQPPGDSEKSRCENAINAIKSAVSDSYALRHRSIKSFVQGSYRNRVDAKAQSDVDVGVLCNDVFLEDYPAGKHRSDFGFVAGSYTFAEFKNDLGNALVSKFGAASVNRGNKAFNVKNTPLGVEADVVPLFEYRHYWDMDNYRAGVALITDNGHRIVNYPERLLDHWPYTPLHYENGVSKNTNTSRAFKGMVRILKQLRATMEKGNIVSASNVPGYLLECLAYNVPDAAYYPPSWNQRVEAALNYMWINTCIDTACNEWTEVDAIKYLFRVGQSWNREQAFAFVSDARHYLGIQ
ncbi:nucleotidyltransferase [Marinicaulis aureus]|uniref:Nucleotidyltransferase n=1 Tax=Hyphococcus aureus TaxID=2666033 RepID=A0ABW1L0F4_9PROT